MKEGFCLQNKPREAGLPSGKVEDKTQDGVDRIRDFHGLEPIVPLKIKPKRKRSRSAEMSEPIGNWDD